jgi:electron transport complex protein RnfA
MSALAALAIFSGLSLNLLLQFGLGIRGIVESEHEWGRVSFPNWVIVCVSALILWLFFTYVLSPPAFGFLESFLLLPATILVSTALEQIFFYFFPGGKFTLDIPSREERGPFNLRQFIDDAGLSDCGVARFSYHGLALASLVLTLRLAVNLAEALALSLGFSLGTLLAAVILREINRRSSLESVPAALRGAPLTLISMGLLYLIFSSVSAIFLRVLGVF